MPHVSLDCGESSATAHAPNPSLVFDGRVSHIEKKRRSIGNYFLPRYSFFCGAVVLVLTFVSPLFLSMITPV